MPARHVQTSAHGIEDEQLDDMDDDDNWGNANDLENSNNLDPDFNNTNLEHPSPPHNLRRSSRFSRKPKEWWIAKPTYSNPSLVHVDASLLASNTPDVPNSYSKVTSPKNIDFWAPGIKRKNNSVHENKIFVLLQHKSGMNIIPCRCVFRVKSSGPKVRIVAKGY